MRPSARRTESTVVAVVGDDTRSCLERLDRGANVVTLAAEPDADPLDRAVAAWSAATRAHAPYFAHRWWPDLDDLLSGIDRVVPDQVGTAKPSATARAI